MSTFKRIVCLMLALVMVFALAACGGNADTGAGTNAGADDTDKGSVNDEITSGGNRDADATIEESGANADTEASISVGANTPGFLGHFDVSGLFSSELAAVATALVYDQLFSIGSDGRWYSDILTDWHWSDEVENQLVLTLKDNVVFSNGDPMTMEDVLYSMNRVAQSPRGGTNFAVIDLDACTISDDGLTLYVQYNTSYGPWQSALNIYIMNEDFVEGLGENPDWYSIDSACGSGPYTCTDNTIGISMSFEKRDDWWMQDEANGSATVKDITAYSYSDNTTMMADYMNGVIDVAIGLTADDCTEISADSSLGTYVTVSSKAVAVIVLSPQCELLQNENIRKAICIGTDSDAVGDIVYGVLGQPASSSLNSSNPYYVDGHAYEYDPEEAKKLVEESGIANPTLTFVTNNQASSTSLAESFQYYMQQIGITVNIESYDNATYIADYLTQGKTDLMINGAAMPTVTNEAADVYTFYRGSFPYPSSAQTDPEIVDLLEKGRMTVDEEERAQIYSDVQDYFYNHYSLVPIAEWYTAYAYNTRISYCDIPVTMSPSLRYVAVAG